MKYIATILLSLILLSFSSVSYGQNLVPNFSFEQYSNCPTTEDQVQFANGWSKYSTNSINTTPDYFNACAPSNGPSVPQNYFFYQPDHRNCYAYMGMITWSSSFSNYREQIGIQLSQPLVIGQKYFLSFYTGMGVTISGSDYIESPSNNIGMRLSTVPFTPSNPAPINNTSHLRSTTIINDTTNWIRVTGSIIADSAYNYLMLGNFYDDANTDTTTLNCGICTNIYSYYLVDDICISTDSSLCNGGIDILPCNVSVEEDAIEDQISIYPNPANNILNITKEKNVKDINISIFNSLGQILYSERKIKSNNKQIDISNYNSGLLFIKIESNNNSFTYKL